MKIICNGISAICIIALMLFSCSKKLAPSHVNETGIKGIDTAEFDYVYTEGIRQKLLGNAGDAIKIFEQCLKMNPNSDAAYYQVAQILLATGDVNNGKKYALKAFELNQKNYWYTMMLAGTYYREKNLDSAIIFYEKAAKTFPEKEEIQLNLGKLYSENKKYDKANEVFENLDRKYGINESSTVNTVRNLMAEGKYAEAEEKDRQLLEKYPDEILYNGLMAEIYSGKGETEKAMKVYNDLLEKNPDNPETQLSLCNFLIDKKLYDELIAFLNKVSINENIDKDEKIKLFSRILETKDLIDQKGRDLLLSCMVLEAVYKDDDIVMMIRPEILVDRKMYAEAEKRLEEIISSNPENYYAWEKLLIVYLDEKDYKNLQEKAEICATKFNRSFLAKLLYATAANENKDYTTAIEELKKATILAGDDKDLLLQVLSLKADVYYHMKDYKTAFETFDEALKNNNSDITILNNYAYYLAEQNIRLKEAEEMAKKVIEKEKNNPTFLDTYGWVLYKRGKINEAAKIMETVINSEDASDAEYYEHYGYILKKKKDCQGAIDKWKIAYKLDSTKTGLLKEIENCQSTH